MCGIVGYCDLRRGIGAEEEVTPIAARSLALLRHRGPDGTGILVDTHACLAHARLRIIDLSEGGRQPMTTPDGRVSVTFNGEIYNYRALREELAARVSFETASDTEVLLHAFRAWGEGAFARLNGMFAAAFWQPEEQQLVLARDRLGKKPLFYYWDGSGRVVFASELKALLPHPFVARELDHQSLARFLAFSYVPTPHTIFKNIYKVGQGTTVTFRGTERAITRYWDLPVDEQDVDERDALDELERLITDAVRLRLESDVPLGFFLSGGIDSTLVTAIGQKLVGGVRSFTVGFRDRRHDEAPQARAIANHLGTQHTELYLDDRDFGDFITRAPRYFDEPFADSSLIATYFLSKATREHVTVALSGDGGDELFCGYQKYANFDVLARTLHVPHVVRELGARALQAFPANISRKVGHAMASRSPDELVRWLVTSWKPDELARLMPGTTLRWEDTQLDATWQRFARRDPLSRFMAADIKSYLCDDILQKIDRASMAVALELRAPLLDYRVVELATSLPLRLKYRHRVAKRPLRALLAKYVPAPLWDRPKHGFNVPVATWYRTERRLAITAAIRELGERLGGALSLTTMTAFLQDHLTGRYDYGQKLFALDTLNEWLKEYS